MPLTEGTLHVSHRVGSVLVVFNARFPARAVEDHSGRVDAHANSPELLLTKPDCSPATNALELLAVDSLRGKDDARVTTRAHLADHDERATTRDDVQLEPADAYVAANDVEASVF